jgi:hypothetical protein
MRLVQYVLVVAAAGAFPALAQEDEKFHIVLPRDAIPAINDPEFETAARAERVMQDDELIIGLAGAREQRAYSTWQLDRHEIVNDVFEGRPIAVTW